MKIMPIIVTLLALQPINTTDYTNNMPGENPGNRRSYSFSEPFTDQQKYHQSVQALSEPISIANTVTPSLYPSLSEVRHTNSAPSNLMPSAPTFIKPPAFSPDSQRKPFAIRRDAFFPEESDENYITIAHIEPRPGHFSPEISSLSKALEIYHTSKSSLKTSVENLFKATDTTIENAYAQKPVPENIKTPINRKPSLSLPTLPAAFQTDAHKQKQKTKEIQANLEEQLVPQIEAEQKMEEMKIKIRTDIIAVTRVLVEMEKHVGATLKKLEENK